MAWFDTFFDEYYTRTYTYLDRERTLRECGFIRHILDLQPEHHILDIPCGFGRHAIELTRQGFNVTGMEYHPVQIARAHEKMKEEEVSFPLIQADMRDIPHEDCYDRVYNYFTSFGYFSDEENGQTLGQFFKALKPGGLLLMELQNRDSYLINHRQARINRMDDGSILLEESRFDVLTSRDLTTKTLVEPGKGLSTRYLELRMYSPHELIALVKKQGFEIQRVCAENETELKADSRRIVLVAKKPSAKNSD